LAQVLGPDLFERLAAERQPTCTHCTATVIANPSQIWYTPAVSLSGQTRACNVKRPMKVGCLVADEQKQASARAFAGADILGVSLGLIVFIAGTLMLVLVFCWSYRLFDSIDSQIAKAQVTAPAPKVQPTESEDNQAPTPQPPPAKGPTLAQVGATIGLRVLVLFVMAYAGSLVATKGAQLLASTMRFRAIVSGRVQGVNFRWYTIQQARAMGLVGMVRNLPSGDVEVIAEGNEDRLQSLLRFLRRGPSAARVDNVDVAWSRPTGEFSRFDISW